MTRRALRLVQRSRSELIDTSLFLTIKALDSVDTLTVSLAAIAGLVATMFACVTADRWHRRRTLHHSAWSTAMFLFAVGSFALWWASSAGWSPGVFRVFFTAGAVLNVAWLALGSLSLFVARRVALNLRRIIALLSAFAIGVMTVAPAGGTFVADELPRARDHFGALPRILAAVGSGVPAMIIFGGTIWSIVQLVARRNAAHSTKQHADAAPGSRLVWSNVFVALGTLVLSASGSLAGRLGEERAFTVTLTIGAVILFIGFMLPSVRAQAVVGRQHLTH